MGEKLPQNADDWLDVVPEDDDWTYYTDHRGVAFPERSVVEQLQIYVPPLLLITGTIGNILSAIVLWKFIQKVLSTCLYLFVVQISDLIVLYLLCGNIWFDTLTGLDIRKKAMLSNNSVCKIFPFVMDLALHLSVWMIAAMSVETTLVLTQPQRLMRLCRLERVRAVILLILVLLICSNAHCFWTYAVSDVDKAVHAEKICSMMRLGNNQQNDDFRRIVWPLVNILITDFFPYFIIFACAVTQITVRVKRKDHLRQLENTWKAYSVDSTAARELQVSFLSVCLSHLFLLLPKMACDVFNYLIQTTMLFLVPYTFRLDAKRILAEGLGNFLLYIYLSTKFFVLIGCCKAFRTEIISMFTCITCKSSHVVDRRAPLPVQSLLNRASHEPPTQEPLLNRASHDPPTQESPLNRASHDPPIQEPLLNRSNHDPPTQEDSTATPSPRKAFSMTSV